MQPGAVRSSPSGPGPCRLTHLRTLSRTVAGPASLPQNGAKKEFPTDIASLLKALDSSDSKTSGRAAEALYNAALEDSAVCRAVCVKHLPRASALLSSSSAATQMFAAYLISALAGTSPSINKELSRLKVGGGRVPPRGPGSVPRRQAWAPWTQPKYPFPLLSSND